jgi:hypothetical protein
MSNRISSPSINNYQLDPDEDPSFSVYKALSNFTPFVVPFASVLAAVYGGRELGRIARRTYNSYYTPAQTPPNNIALSPPNYGTAIQIPERQSARRHSN